MKFQMKYHSRGNDISGMLRSKQTTFSRNSQRMFASIFSVYGSNERSRCYSTVSRYDLQHALVNAYKMLKKMNYNL